MAMSSTPLSAISPLDGRYAKAAAPLATLFSEFGLIRLRVCVEIAWFRKLAAAPEIPELPSLTAEDEAYLEAAAADFSMADAERVKALESVTNHDVKAVEYWVKELLEQRPTLRSHCEFVHFACTSEDINNLAYALALYEARERILLPQLAGLTEEIAMLAEAFADIPMAARTHGQLASPTTLGKELANYVMRLRAQLRRLAGVRLAGKFGGAVGNYNAHLAAYPGVDWLRLCEEFVTDLHLAFNAYTTQIEPHDWMVEYCQALRSCNRILVGFDRDVWGYISLGYFRQKADAEETGSSTMPHKINPIDFENSEGNLGVANALLDHLADALPVSRWQRDLSDSTILRNLGVALGHGLVAWNSCRRGLKKLEAAPEVLRHDLEDAWQLLAEPVQTVMRKHGFSNPYEQLKALTRNGQKLNHSELTGFLRQLPLPESERHQLLELTPASYTGLAAPLAAGICSPEKGGLRVEVTSWEEDEETLQAIRHEVFVVGQSVPQDIEWDGLDEDAVHLIAYWEDRPVGVARILPASGQIGRMAVITPWRGLGVGLLLLQALVEECERRGLEPFLNAQIQALGFYEKAGFQASGPEFFEADIPHLRMTLRPPAP